MDGLKASIGQLLTHWDALPHPSLKGVLVIVFAALVGAVLDLLARTVALRIVQATETELDDKLLEILRRPVVFLPILGALFYALMSWDIGETARFTLRGLFATGVVFYYGRVALQVSDTLLEHLSHEDGERRGFVQAATLPIFQIGAQVVVYGGAAYFVLLAWNVDVSAWIASAGIVGIAVGFAAKDTLANLFAGVFILADRPYKLNDYLLLETGERGRVTRIGIRTTRMQTNDDVEVIIPNAEMANARIVNESGGRHEKFRIRTVVEVAYGTDVEEARAVLMEVARSTQYVVTDDHEVRPRARLMAFGASGLEFHLLVWVPEPRYKNYVIDQLNTNIYKRFNERGIEIPYSKHEVFLRKLDELTESD